MHGNIRSTESTTLFPEIISGIDRAFVQRHTARFAQALIRKYKTLGPEFFGVYRFDSQKQKLSLHLAQLLESEEMQTDARMIVDVGLLYTNQGRRLVMNGEIMQPGLDDSIYVNQVLGADPILDTRKFLARMVKKQFITAEGATDFISDYDDLQESKKPEPVKRKWSAREKFARMKLKHLRRAFVEEKGHLYKTVDFSVNPRSKTFRLTFHAKAAFEGRHTVIEGNYHIDGWNSEKGRPQGMTMTIGKMSIAREFQMAAGLNTLDLAVGDRHENTIDHLSFLLESTGAITPDAQAEKAAQKDRRERPSREQRSAIHRTGRRLMRMSARKFVAR